LVILILFVFKNPAFFIDSSLSLGFIYYPSAPKSYTTAKSLFSELQSIDMATPLYIRFNKDIGLTLSLNNF